MPVCDYPVCDQDAITQLDVNGEEKGSCEEHLQHFADQSDAGQESNVAARYKASPLSLTVFQNGEDLYNARLQRAYTRDDGETFERTESLRTKDLRKAARLLQKAADDLQEIEVETQ